MIEKEGLGAEDAYNLSLKEYQSRRRREEMEERVAQEQFLQQATVPTSHVIEELLMEEKRLHDNEQMESK